MPDDYYTAAFHLASQKRDRSVQAMFLLAEMFQHGRGTDKDILSAIEYYKRVACISSHDKHLKARASQQLVRLERETSLEQLYQNRAFFFKRQILKEAEGRLKKEPRAKGNAYSWLTVQRQLDQDLAEERKKEREKKKENKLKPGFGAMFVKSNTEDCRIQPSNNKNELKAVFGSKFVKSNTEDCRVNNANDNNNNNVPNKPQKSEKPYMKLINYLLR